MNDDIVTIPIPEWVNDKRKVGVVVITMTLFILFISSLFSKGEKVDTFTVESEKLTEVDATANAKSRWHLMSLYMNSGLYNEQADFFDSMATQFQQEPGHYCQGTSKKACLLSFQATRESEILSLATSKVLPDYERRQEIAQRLFDIQAIELAIIGLSSERDPYDEKFINTLITERVDTAPVAGFIQAFSSYRMSEELKESARIEELKNSMECEGECL